MSKSLQIFFFFFLSTQICFAQFEFYNNEQPQKISSEQLTNALSVNLDSLMLDSIIIAYKNSQSIPGIATMIIKDNEVIWKRNYGYRNLQYQLPVEDSTFFLVGSISKTIVATAVMQLWENGLIALDNSINDYLPSGFTVVNPYFPNDTITVKMLMTHTSSLQDNWNVMDYLWTCGDYPVTYDTFLVNYFTPGGTYYNQNNFYNYPPGQNWNYSNAGSCLLALMVEHLSGKSFEEYTWDSIFIPLSMNATSWFLQGFDTSKIATPYMYQPPAPMCQTGMAYWPIGQLRTNKIELSNFLSAYINGGVFNNNRILNSSTIEMMLKDQLGFGGYHNGMQGLIWMTDPLIYDTVWSHSGGWYGATAWMFCNPIEKWGSFLFINWATPPNYPSIILNTQMAYFAHLYGNIYSSIPSIDKYYANVNMDSVLFRTRFSNIYNHQFTPHLIYTNQGSTLIDSITLFDDGLHRDSIPNDGIFGGYIPPQQTESFFSLAVSTIDKETEKYFSTPIEGRFTISGPVVIDSISIRRQFTNYAVIPFVHNAGNTATIPDASIKLICNDPWVKSIGSSIASLPNLSPNISTGISTWCSVSYVDSLFPGYFNFQVEVRSDNFAYWTDSIRVNVITGIDIDVQHPLAFKLEQNYPNPFNPTTTIGFGIIEKGNVRLSVLNILGEELRVLLNEEKEAGYHSIDFNASDLPSGVYFYQLRATPSGGQAGSFVDTRKMLLLR